MIYFSRGWSICGLDFGWRLSWIVKSEWIFKHEVEADYKQEAYFLQLGNVRT